MATYTDNLFSLYIPEVETDNTQTDFFPGLTENFEKISAQLSNNWITPQQMGAKGDYEFQTRSGTDDAAAFQAALDIARDRGSVNLLIPPGIYRLASELTLYKNTRIVAAPGARMVRDHERFIAINGERNQPIAPGIYEGAGNIRITGGIWDGNSGNRTQPGGGFYFGHATNILIDHVTIRDVYQESAIVFSAISGFTVKDSYLIGCGGTSTDIPAIRIANATADAIILPADGESCVNGRLVNNYFGGSDFEAPHGWAVGTKTGVVDKQHVNILVEGNTMEYHKKYAVYAYNWTRSQVVNNEIKSCGAGIRIKTIDPANTEDTKTAKGVQTGASAPIETMNIEGNTITSGITEYYPILFDGFTGGKIQNSTISNNRVMGDKTVQKWTGIYLKQTEDTTIDGNILSGIGGHGIYLTERSNNTVINGNIIRNTLNSGISISNSSHYQTISNNQIKFAGSDGIKVDGAESVNVTGNNINAANTEGGSYSYIYILGGSNAVALTGNTVRSNGTNGTTAPALTIASGVTKVTRSGNVWAGVGAVKDSAGSTKAGDIE